MLLPFSFTSISYMVSRLLMPTRARCLSGMPGMLTASLGDAGAIWSCVGAVIGAGQRRAAHDVPQMILCNSPRGTSKTAISNQLVCPNACRENDSALFSVEAPDPLHSLEFTCEAKSRRPR